MASEQAVEFANLLGAWHARFSPDLDLTTARDIYEAMHLLTREPEGVSYAEEDAGGVEALWCIPADSNPDAVLLHNHWGGCVYASCHSDRKAAAHIARAAGVRSLVLNYRLAPEHKFPAQSDDVRNAYDWLLQEGYQPDKIASVGHSIGGNLAISLALGLRDEGAALPGAIATMSPWLELPMTNATITSNADRDKIQSPSRLEFFRSAWLDGTGVGYQDPRVNVFAADLSQLPPISVYYGADELLAGEAAEFARRAQAAGNDVLVREVPAGQHSMVPLGAGWVPEVDQAIAETGDWLRFKLGLAALQDTTKLTM